MATTMSLPFGIEPSERRVAENRAGLVSILVTLHRHAMVFAAGQPRRERRTKLPFDKGGLIGMSDLV